MRHIERMSKTCLTAENTTRTLLIVMMMMMNTVMVIMMMTSRHPKRLLFWTMARRWITFF